jgi:hypothetical protein
MENNRRNFFKGIATFVSGVVVAKMASYTPKKPQEELMVSASIVFNHDGETYHPIVVKKKEEDVTRVYEASKDDYVYDPSIRKLDV